MEAQVQGLKVYHKRYEILEEEKEEYGDMIGECWEWIPMRWSTGHWRWYPTTKSSPSERNTRRLRTTCL